MKQGLETGVNKQEVAYQTIRQRILEGRYGPGHRFIIDELSRELGVSQTPVREAIRRLEAEGLVQYQRYSGVRVAPINPEAYVETLSVLAVLEGYAASAASPHLTKEDLEQLRKMLLEMERALAGMDFMEFGRLNREFHWVTVQRCGNACLLDNIRNLRAKVDAVRRNIFMVIPRRGEESLAEHRRIYELLAAQAAPEEIETFVRRHKLRTVEAFQIWKREGG
ncbi:GntR family transcriptional regulator [Kyrpidia tusciae]|uniref:Transcriptional regulator, GntR family n=1 Tax=Kyrpidia tusciae (strain DSM 2912 / NBRC 15312 / T2) TaxID=562970 RepID=D5WPM4_KYRT2|nr:GntR family transcriptional regulator [Kyrpidia tusciae]ADG06283.1 transcriptional regulator, GntR family [Kyrpidia tusciae DSM 2912]